MANNSCNDIAFLRQAIVQAHRSTPVPSAYCVGAVLVSGDDEPRVLATGYSRELPGNTHAEECALLKYAQANPKDNALTNATMYTTMEPCSTRLSGNTPCTERIIRAGLARVVLGVKEPDNFVQCEGVRLLQAAGIRVDYLAGFEQECLAPNSHILNVPTNSASLPSTA
ncbi:hypothetical protein IWQ62_003987 [Dispira parvispora]|uniref:CMP/dCMP-type deaminase domain-containing protein n=1 Tax=Dispira parvispora TaxID=1520584 RepID=A0A9W8E5U2_9FUNG|nr:hypothetical protein IWQ62_003987 [Dispira parvispora]